MDSLTELKEIVSREKRKDETDSMIDNTQNNILEIKERITRLGEENRQLIMENAMLREEIHELRDEEMNAIKDIDNYKELNESLEKENNDG